MTAFAITKALSGMILRLSGPKLSLKIDMWNEINRR